MSIEALKRRTRCGICKQTGHWHKECPNRGSQAASNEVHFFGFEEFQALKQSVVGVSSREGAEASDLAGDRPSSGAYVSALHSCVHELMYLHESLIVNP